MDQDRCTLDLLKFFVRRRHEICSYILAQVPHMHDANDLFDQFKPGTNFAAWGIEVMRYGILVYHRTLAQSKRALMDDSLFRTLMARIPTMQNEAAARIQALHRCQALLGDRAKRPIKMRRELSIPVEMITSYLRMSGRHVYHVLGQITAVLLRWMRRALGPALISSTGLLFSQCPVTVGSFCPAFQEQVDTHFLGGSYRDPHTS
jgi:RNA polymerase sigma-70 factor (ECF subfamily)